MNTANDLTLLVDDLAGHWTESALEILTDAGIRQVSVAMEVEIWKTLKKLVRSELRGQQEYPFSTLGSLSALMEQVLRRAAMRAAQQFEPQALTADFKARIWRSAGERRFTATERGLYADIVRQPGLGTAFKPSYGSGFTPRLRVSALGG